MDFLPVERNRDEIMVEGGMSQMNRVRLSVKKGAVRPLQGKGPAWTLFKERGEQHGHMGKENGKL